MTTRVLIAEDEPLAAEALADWVKAMRELELVGRCAGQEEDRSREDQDHRDTLHKPPRR